MTSPLVFLGGAGLQAWIWDDVRARLAAGGVSGSVAQYPSEGSLRDYATKVLQDAPERFVLVAHSVGGVVGSQILAQAPERVDGFLGIAAIIPPAGRSFLGALPLPNRLVVGLAMRVAGTRPPEKMLRQGLANDLDQELADRIVRDFTPESKRLYRDPVDLRDFPGHRGYVRTTNDKEVPVGLQDGFAATLQSGWTRSMPTGHLPMLADPAGLTDLVREFLTADDQPR